jgi:hypothetical protein
LQNLHDTDADFLGLILAKWADYKLGSAALKWIQINGIVVELTTIMVKDMKLMVIPLQPNIQRCIVMVFLFGLIISSKIYIWKLQLL